MADQELRFDRPMDELWFAPLPGRETLQDVPREEIINRRDFLRLSRQRTLQAGAIALAAQYGWMAHVIADNANQINDEMNERWPHNEPSVGFLDGASYTGQTELTIYLPGCGDVHSEEEAQIWKRRSGLRRDHLTAFVDYSNEGTDIPGIVKTLRENIDFNRVRKVNYVCRSIGGLYVLPVAAEIGVPVGGVVFMASPSRLSNGDFGELGELVSHLPENRPIGTLLKFIYNCMLSIRNRGFDPGVNIAEGWKGTMSGASEEALHKEIKTAADVNIFDKALQLKLRRVIIPGFTRADYTATDKPRSDKTVLVVASGREFQQEFVNLGVDLRLRGMPYDGHANVDVTAYHMQEWTDIVTSPAHILASK